MIAIFVAQFFGSSKAHLNPVVTLFFAVLENNYSFIYFIIPQLLGAFLGSILVWIFYCSHYKDTKDTGTVQATFFTSPAINDKLFNFLSEFMATIILVIGIVAINKQPLSPGLSPFLVGILVWAIGLSLGGATGYAINPARDLGPRIGYWLIFNKDRDNAHWKYAWIPIFAPLLAAFISALVLKSLQIY